MTLVADSGSTKTIWADVESGSKVVTEGLNPHFSTDEQVLSACNTVKKVLSVSKPVLFFYGAGCGSADQRTRMHQLLCQGLDATQVFVETDMLGACRATSGREASLVGILGTGSNSCYYDGTCIAQTYPSLGYILGDEGSANHIGRILLTEYLNGTLTKETTSLFHDSYPYKYEEWIDHIYHKPNANRFLASLAIFAVNNLDNSECKRIVANAIDQWYCIQLQRLIESTRCNHINVIGGLAKAIEPFLRHQLSEKGLDVGTVSAEPINGLVQFHALKIS